MSVMSIFASNNPAFNLAVNEAKTKQNSSAIDCRAELGENKLKKCTKSKNFFLQSIQISHEAEKTMKKYIESGKNK